MAEKEIAIEKKLKISTAQQNMILAVLGASVVLGAAACLTIRFAKQISFNANVIMAQEESIAKYSDAIKITGACKAPSGSVYSDAELASCDPNNIDIEEVSGSLRANILGELASNAALNSVPKDTTSSCVDPETGKKFTYNELIKKYHEAKGAEQLSEASQLIKSCSALRVIPDALPAYVNEEALLASLNQIFKISDWEPESISPTGEMITPGDDGSGDTSLDGTDTSSDTNTIGGIALNLSIEADSAVTTTVLNNIDRSIRQFNIMGASIEWGGDNSLIFHANAAAFYTQPSSIIESSKTIQAEGQ